MSELKQSSNKSLPPILLPDSDTLMALQEYLKRMLQKTIEIQTQNLTMFRTVNSQKKLLQMRENPLVKLKLKQLAFSRTSTESLVENPLKKNTIIRSKSDLSIFENGAFKKRKTTSDSTSTTENTNTNKAMSVETSPTNLLVKEGSLCLKLNSKIPSDDSTYSFGSLSEAPTKASFCNSEESSPMRHSQNVCIEDQKF